MALNINIPKGTKVMFTGQDKYQRQWGGHDEADGVLSIGQVYTVERINTYSSRTLVWLEEVPNKHFNSVCFREI